LNLKIGNGLEDNTHTGNNSEYIEGVSLWSDAWRRLKGNRMAMAGSVVLSIIVLACILSPWISPHKFWEIHSTEANLRPCARYWFGTDHLGRCVFSRVLEGGRISLLVGVVATTVSILIGVTIGALSGLRGGLFDNIAMRIVDILYGLPFMFFVIILVVMFGRNIINLFIALGCVQWLTMARITRGQALSIRAKEYIMAARTSGAGTAKILFRHVIPNLLGPVIVYATLTVPAVMLEEAFLSFLGLGVQAPMTSWGAMASEGITTIEYYPWQIFFPGAALALTLFSLNFLGEGLRDALDPQMKDKN
jgi:oligopeptide transport system permease protein